MNPQIQYLADSAPSGFPLSLVVRPDGIATLTVQTSRDATGAAAVGLFRCRLEDRELAPLVAALRSAGFAAAENPKKVLPGEPVRLLGITEMGSKELVRRAAFHTPEPPAFAAAEEQALKVVDLVRQRPVRAIAIEAGPLPKRLESGKPLALTLTLVNPGTERVQLPDPARWEEEGVQLHIDGLRSDVPLPELGPEHQKLAEVGKDQALGEQAPLTGKGPITLERGARFLLRMRVPLDWPPGQYELTIVLAFPLPLAEGQEPKRCELVATPGRIEFGGAR